MSITLDTVIAGMRPPETFIKAVTGTLVAGRPHSTVYQAGRPGAFTAPSPGIAGAALTSYAGQIPFTNPTGGKNTYLARFQGSATQAGVLILADRLWHNSGISVTTTGAQTVDSVAWPARDMNASTDGVGVQIGLEVVTATGAGAATPTISYTNSGGTGSRAGAMWTSYVASSIAGSFYPFTMAAGDVGVRSIQTVTLGVSMTSGSVSLVAYRELARLELTANNIPNAIDAITSGLPRLFDNTVPFLIFVPNTTTTSNIGGQIIFSHVDPA